MKKLFTLAVIVAATCMAIPAQAQFKFGLKGGLNVTNMSFSSDVTDVSNRTGFFIGPTAKFTIPILGFGIDASVLYDQREAKVDATGEKFEQKAINIPVNLRYDIGLSSIAALYLAAGPQFGFNIGDKTSELFEGGNWKLSNSTFSVNVGAGVMLLSHLQVGANYNIVCGKTGEVSVIEGAASAIRGRSNSWQVSLAYYF